MIPIRNLLFAAFASVTVFGLWNIFQIVYRELTSPIRRLRGPKATSWIYGNLRDIWKGVRHGACHITIVLDATDRVVLAHF